MTLEFNDTNLNLLFIASLASKKARNLPPRRIKIESRPISQKNGLIV